MNRFTIFICHPDDDIIGCFSLLEHQLVDKIVMFHCDMSPIRKREFIQAGAHYDVETLAYNKEPSLEYVDAIMKDTESVPTFPDPHHETHPEHKILGSIGAHLFSLAEQGVVGFYTVNMKAPYVRAHKRQTAIRKKAVLDQLYPDQADLWAADARYWLFEGQTLWYRDDS